MRIRSILQFGLAGALLSITAGAVATPIMTGDLVKVGNKAGNVWTPSAIAGDNNGLHSRVKFKLDNQRTMRVTAGMFVLDQKSTTTANAVWDQFYSFCLQPDVYLTPFSNPYRVQSIGSSVYKPVLAELWGRNRHQVVNDITAAAFQVAVWELAYDGDRKLGEGVFQLVSGGAVAQLAGTWLAQLDGTGPMDQGLRVLASNPNKADRQDLLTSVPEPGVAALLLLSLIGLSFRGRATLS